MIKTSRYWILLIYSVIALSGLGQSEYFYFTRRTIKHLHQGCQYKFEVLTERMQIDTKADLMYSWYDKEGLHYSQGYYAGYLLDGEYIEYDLTGAIIAKGWFNKGLKNGSWVSNNKKDSRIRFQTWKNGYKHGEFKEYNLDHQLLKTAIFKRGQLKGWYTTYDADTIVEKKYYRKGIEVEKKSRKN